MKKVWYKAVKSAGTGTTVATLELILSWSLYSHTIFT